MDVQLIVNGLPDGAEPPDAGVDLVKVRVLCGRAKEGKSPSLGKVR